MDSSGIYACGVSFSVVNVESVKVGGDDVFGLLARWQVCGVVEGLLVGRETSGGVGLAEVVSG